MKMRSAERLLPLITMGAIMVAATSVADSTNEIAAAAPAPQPSTTLSEMSLEELMNIEVTTVSKRPERLSEAAAAVYVLTPEEIRRSGATSIPEALRLVPGVQVARLDGHTWAITARGFNDQFANKLLVMIDGRTVYTPLFSGVFWDVQNTMLEDVDRIEVVRGPGGTLWGANAVNGVINIITKSAKETQGLLVTGGGGSEELGFGGIRYGLKMGTDTYLRLYTQFFIRGDQPFPGGADGADQWNMTQGGFRLDRDMSGDDHLTVQGDAYGGREGETVTIASPTPPFGQTINDEYDVNGANALGRWTHAFANGSDMTLQAYYDRTYRKTSYFRETRNTGDIDFQHRFTLGNRQEIVWGGEFRVTSDTISNSYTVAFDPDGDTLYLASGFVQDAIAIVPEKLDLSIGAKFEYNTFTDFNIQPNVRLMWKPAPRQTVWAAVSRAVRTPSQALEDATLHQPAPAPLPGVVELVGDHNVDSEDLLAFELGYRAQPIKEFSLDVATFYNVYDKLRSSEPIPPPGLPVVAAFQFENKLDGESYGVEAAGHWLVTDWWRIDALYSFIRIFVHTTNGGVDKTGEDLYEGATPQNQVVVRSSMDLPRNVQLDFAFRYVDALAMPDVPSYFVMDTRLTWRPKNNLELTVVGQNLFDNRHLEFGPTFVPIAPTEVPHGVYGKVTWSY